MKGNLKKKKDELLNACHNLSLLIQLARFSSNLKLSCHMKILPGPITKTKKKRENEQEQTKKKQGGGFCCF